MYVKSNIYKVVKAASAITGTGGSVLAIIYGALLSGGLPFIIGGSLCLANSIFNLVEFIKVNPDICDEIKRLDEKLRSSTKLNGKFRREVSELRKLFYQSTRDIDELRHIQQNLLTINSSLKMDLTHFKTATAELEKTVSQLEEKVAILEGLNNDLTTENVSQSTIITDSKRIISKLVEYTNMYNNVLEQLQNENFEKVLSTLEKQVVPQLPVSNEGITEGAELADWVI